jgi:hypothetical protein
MWWDLFKTKQLLLCNFLLTLDYGVQDQAPKHYHNLPKYLKLAKVGSNIHLLG